MRNIYLTFCILSLIPSAAWSQTAKRPLNGDDYDSWKSVKETTMSKDGKWIAYEVNPQEGDGQLFVENPSASRKVLIPRGYDAQFSADAKYLVAKIKTERETVRQAKKAKVKKEKMPKDSLVVVNLASGQKRAYGDLVSFALPKDAGLWLAMATKMPESKKDSTDKKDSDDKKAKEKKSKKPKGDLLTLLNISGSDSVSFENVNDYALSDQGGRVIFTREILKDTSLYRGIYEYTFTNKKTQMLDTSSKVEVYKNLTLDKKGEQAVWMSSPDTAKADVKRFALHFRDFGRKSNVLIADTVTKGWPSYWAPSEFQKPKFSDDGRRLYFGAAPVGKPSLKDTTMLDEELSRVDVWSHTDAKLQPMQDKQRKEMLERNYWTYYDVNSRKVVPLGNEEMAYVTINYRENQPHFLGKSFEPYQKSSSWEPGHSDLYWIDAATGKNTLIARDVLGQSEISPAGKYAIWFDERDTLWKVYEHQVATIRNLTKDLPVAFHDEEHDTPDMPNSYGAAGWTKDDKYVLIYDRYDIWRFDPTLKEKPVNLTNGYGRKEKVRLKYLETREKDEEMFIDLSKNNLLWGQWEDDKQTGLLDWKAESDPTIKVKESYYFLPNSFKKAKDAEVYAYEKGNFTHPNELFYVQDWKNPQQLTNLFSQTNGIKWGSAEQVSWISSQGVTLEGLLFKPENFDPSRKYPMLVYYYERNATSLHVFRAPAPSRSTINIPYCVSNDYLVFVPDIVYGNGTPGKNAYDCIVSGVLDLVDKGFVDRNNIGIQGQSWGGYQTAYLITQTNLFKAAMAGAIVANMTSAYGGIRWSTGMSRMFQYEKTQSRIGGTLWEKPLYYIENSPLFYADRVETPLLMMHNDADGSVPWYQGIEFFTALRRLSKPVWMLVYNDEDHNLTKRPNMKDLSTRMYQFFDHYLKAAPMPVWMSEGRTVLEKERWDMKLD
ncbi:prolyl oligopeptidase family serine peptidase [Persicitalea sp.]|uniref:S9 family peptidase n=1 Tax=Persicitalea sp. TaxID=3100273 RepID=UPI003593412A